MPDKKKYYLLDKPIIGTFVLFLLSYFVPILASKLFSSFGYVSDVVCLVLSVGFLILYRFIFRDNYSGIFAGQSFKSILWGLVYCIPLILIALMNLLSGANFSNFSIDLLIMAIYAGVCEEISYRGLIVSNIMRLWTNKKGIVSSAIFSSLLFGGMHLANMFMGATVEVTILQACYAAAMGFLLAAALLRCGNILPCMIVHFLIDFFALMTDELSSTDGIDTSTLPYFLEPEMIVIYVVILLCLAVGIFLLRRSKHNQIIELWSSKYDGSQTM